MITTGLVKSMQDIMRQDDGIDGDAQRLSQLVWMVFLKILDDTEMELELLDDKYPSAIPNELQWRSWASDEEGLTGDSLNAFVNNELFPQLRSLTPTSNPRTRIVREAFEDSYNYMKSGTLLRQIINKVNTIDFNSSTDRHEFNDLYEQLLRDLQNASNAGEYYTPRPITELIVELVNPQVGESIIDPACGTGGFLSNAIDHVRRQVTDADEERLLQQSIRGIEKKQLPHVLCLTNMMLHGIDSPTSIRRANTLGRPLRDYGPDDRVDVILTNPPFGGIEEPGVEQNFPIDVRTRETADLFLVLIMRMLKNNGRAGIVLPNGTLFGEGVKTRIKEQLLRECNLHTIIRLPNSVFAPYTPIATNLLFFTKGRPTQGIWFYEHKMPSGYKAYSKTKPLMSSEFDELRAWWNNRAENDSAWYVPAEEIQTRNFDLDVTNPRTKPYTLRAVEELVEQSAIEEKQIEMAANELAETLRAYGPESNEVLGVASSVHRLIDVPDVIPFIEQVTLTAILSGAQDTATAVPGDVNSPWKIPSDWNWKRLDSAADSVLGKMLDNVKNRGEPLPYLRNTNVRWFDFDLSDLKLMRFEPNEYERYGVEPGDVIICEGGEPGRAAVWRDTETRLHIQKALHRVRCGPDLNPDWLVLTLRLYMTRRILSRSFTGIGIQHLTGASLKKLAIPMPERNVQDELVHGFDLIREKLHALDDALTARTSAI